MILKLAIRNVTKNFSKRLPLAALLATTILLLFLGNTLFENADRGFKIAYVQSFTGNLSLSAQSREQFTIFGSDLPLVGENLILPVLPKFDEIKAKVEALGDVQIIPMVSAAAAMDWNGFSPKVPVFGVDFTQYLNFFPSLKLVKGSIPPSTGSYVLLNKTLFDKAAQRFGKEPEIGETLTLSFSVNNSFVIREVKLAGVYTYPVSDAVLDRIVLADVDTARALNGYVYGAGELKTTGTSEDPANTDVESMFSGVQDTVVDPGQTVNIQSIEKDLSKTENRQALNRSIEGAWNFLIIKTPDQKIDQLKSDLTAQFKSDPVQVRDWRETAGGNSQIVWLLRLLFNSGFIFIAIVTSLIVVNSFSLSLTERTKEIGTMRALGAQKHTVAKVLSYEILILVMGAGLIGVLLGVLFAYVGTMAQIPVGNVFLSALLGSSVLKFHISLGGVLMHLGICFLIGIGALAVPVNRALKITPSRAMSRE